MKRRSRFRNLFSLAFYLNGITHQQHFKTNKKKQIKKPNISLNVTAELILVKRNISCLF
jgi:hypothetical protein